MQTLEIGNFAQYHLQKGRIIKGKIIDIVNDPSEHMIYIFKVTSRTSIYFPGTEIEIPHDSPFLKPRKRY